MSGSTGPKITALKQKGQPVLHFLLKMDVEALKTNLQVKKDGTLTSQLFVYFISK